MTDYIRRLVSGPKTRFVDANHDLDLIYLTDNIIIMGYPAAGFEGLYRNHRDDTKRFLDGRHGTNYWVFNFCPLRENSYDGDALFGGRVSRFPFPDHHVPPFALLPIVAREIRAWLEGGKERVAVLHCKAGKGRSGSMACSYLLALEEEMIEAPKLERSYSTKEWAQRRAEDIAEAMPLPDEKLDSNDKQKDKLAQVLDLHTSRRMKNTSGSKGVSIPSQRRWLGYWSLVLASSESPSSFIPSTFSPKIRITQLVVRMKDLPFLSSTSLQSNIKVWASLAKYDDAFVELLEKFEESSRDPSGSGHTMGIRRQEGGPDIGAFRKELDSGKFDREKMVRRFATMSGTAKTDSKEKLVTYTLTADSNQDLTLSASRELRVKLFLGQVFLCWCWFIPRFHFLATSLVLEKKDLDFAIGLGSLIVDVSVHWENSEV